MSYHKKSIQKNIPAILLSACALIYTTSSVANTDNSSVDFETESISQSVSYNANNIPTTSEQLESTKTIVTQPLVKSTLLTELSNTEKAQDINYYNTSYDFSIYNATATLMDDMDYDGFYHHFSVSIDADTTFSSARVYAKLYLSYQGGPWNYYASSDAYYIYADSDQDRIIIETELADGYPAGFYDIRIELYDATYNEWLVSYGPYDNYTLSSLALEDSYEDSYDDNPHSNSSHYIETDIAYVGNGAMSFMLLLIPALTLMRKRYS